jgi:microcystin-dependent protein
MFIEPYLATVTIFAGNFAPRSWAFCDGSLQSISDNTPLFALLGTTYGGDGVTTFALPDLRGRSAVGAGQGPGQPNYLLGQMSGTENTTLLVSNLPAHNHMITSITGNPGSFDSGGNSNSPQGNIPAEITGRYAAANPDGQMAPSVSLSNTPVVGANTPVSNLSPYLAMNYIIAVEGIFPSRS